MEIYVDGAGFESLEVNVHFIVHDNIKGWKDKEWGDQRARGI